jgi:hypothetical protein
VVRCTTGRADPEARTRVVHDKLAAGIQHPAQIRVDGVRDHELGAQRACDALTGVRERASTAHVASAAAFAAAHESARRDQSLERP